MAINFKKIAKENTVVSEIMENRTKVEKANGKYHISEFDIVASEKGPYAVCAISDTEFINGGFVLSKIFLAIVDEYEGDINAAREDFASEGGLDVRLERTTTKSGKPLTKVEVL